MACILPSSDIRNKYNEISEFCNTYNEPVYLTKNGREDLVVLSNSEYERITERFYLASLLDQGMEDIHDGRYRPAEAAFAALEKKYGI